MADNKPDTKPIIETPVTRDDTGWHLNFDFTLDSLIVIGLFAFTLWRKILRPFLAEKFYWAINPFEEERKIPILLAQMKAVTSANQVLVGTFHNGELDQNGYHLKKFSVIYFWCEDGSCTPRNLPTNVPAEKLANEITKTNATEGWFHTTISDVEDPNCITYLRDNGLSASSTRMIMMGNIPIGMISIQYKSDDFSNRKLKDHGTEAILEELFVQLQGLMKRRFKHCVDNANIFRKLFGSR